MSTSQILSLWLCLYLGLPSVWRQWRGSQCSILQCGRDEKVHSLWRWLFYNTWASEVYYVWQWHERFFQCCSWRSGYHTIYPRCKYEYSDIITRSYPANTKHLYNILYNVGPTSKTLGRRCTNVIQMFCVCWVVIYFHLVFVLLDMFPENIKHNVGWNGYDKVHNHLPQIYFVTVAT